ncbi:MULTISPECIES: phosphonate ABC transporter, permease protein PhnE [unclassified Luteococcus]|uniref:phosphonate ABC transporter, permease protein PhnE n=1 Tax=unclassified Luteococcus TaxID=2639923 RepID=UPI00313EE5DA
MSSPAAVLDRRPTPVQIPPRPAPAVNSIAVAGVLLGLFALSVWSVIDLRINIASLADSGANARNFLGRMLPLDFPPLGELAVMIGQTLAIVGLATLFSVLLSLPLALLAAQGTTTGPAARQVSRGLIVLARAIPDLVLAIFFFRVFGLGALPGIFAMGLHSVGMVAKLYADAIEEIDPGPRLAIRAAGGSRLQQVVTGVLPQLFPQIIATALHRFDINLRTSVLLGYVGVGGIGLAIADALRSLNYQRGMALAFTVLVLCILVELVSGAMRAALLRRPTGTARQRPTHASRPGVAVAALATRVQDRRAPDSLDERLLSPPWTPERVSRVVWTVLFAAAVAVSLLSTEISPRVLWRGLLNLPENLALFFPPGGTELLPDLVEALWVTVEIALAATLLGSLLAIPIGILAARNVVPIPAVHTCFRVLIVVIRGIPELILAIIFVVVSGLGAVAGTLALSVGAVGLLSKLVADSLEETDVDVQTAVAANGASRVQVFFAVTLRQALPAFVAHVLYLLDTNIRSATLLGVVGAGGIGFTLLNAARVVQFDVVTTVVGLILAVVLLVEALALWVRATVR